MLAAFRAIPQRAVRETYTASKTTCFQVRHIRTSSNNSQKSTNGSSSFSILGLSAGIGALVWCVSDLQSQSHSSLAAQAAVLADTSLQQQQQQQQSNLLLAFKSRVPVKALAPIGACQFTATPQAVQLLDKARVNHNTSLLRFACPNRNAPLNLSTCACILAKAQVSLDDGVTTRTVLRPYTPISTNDQVGSFDLLVKHYDKGKMSQHLLNLKVGDKLEFLHGPRNVKIQYPFKAKHIGMIVGGTGITPMIQALHAILGDTKSDSRVTLLYGSRTSEDILGKEILDFWQRRYPHRLEVVHVLSEEPEDSPWQGRRGFISKRLIEQTLPPPTKGQNVMIFVCGPPALYEIFCGPQDEPLLTGILYDVGYHESQVYKF